MNDLSASEEIVAVVSGWPGVEVGPGDRGSLSIRLGKREIGHLHGDHAAHFAFPREQWREFLDSGRVVEHPIRRDGLAARRIDGPDDVRDVIELLRLNYDRGIERHGLPVGGA
jgi:hypothetical protein